MEELYDNVIKKLQNDLHPDDFHDLMRGKIKKQIIEMVIKEYTDLGITDLDFITNRVRDRFGLGFDPNSSIEDKILRDLEYMLDYEHNLKGASPNKIFKNEYKTIERMKGEKSAAIAKQMIDQYRYKVRNNMKLIEAQQILSKYGFILEDTETEEDRLDSIRGDEWRLNAQYDRDHDYPDYHDASRMVDIRKRARELQQSSVEQKIANAKKFNGENPKEVNSLNNYAEMLKSLGIEIDEYKVGRAFDVAMDAKPGYIQFDLGMGKLKKPEKIIIVRGELNFEGKHTKLTLEVVTEYSKALVKTLPRVEKEVSGVSEAKEEIIKYCHSVVAKDKLAKFVNGVFRGSVPPYISIAGLIEAQQILHSKGFLLEYHNEEISPEKHELIEEILDDPMCDSDLDYYTLADWSIDDLENYKNELNDLHNEERYVNDPFGMDE